MNHLIIWVLMLANNPAGYTEDRETCEHYVQLYHFVGITDVTCVKVLELEKYVRDEDET